MLFYDWKRIVRYSGGSSKLTLLILQSMLRTSTPRNKFDPIFKYYYIDFSGNSFLVHATELMAYRYKWRDKELAEYIGLASFRNLGEYKASGKVSLDLLHSPIGEDAINNNRLLRISGDQIHFYYEEAQRKREILWQV